MIGTIHQGGGQTGQFTRQKCLTKKSYTPLLQTQNVRQKKLLTWCLTVSLITLYYAVIQLLTIAFTSVYKKAN